MSGDAAFHPGVDQLHGLLAGRDRLAHILEFGIVLAQVEVSGGDLRDQSLHHRLLVLVGCEELGARRLSRAAQFAEQVDLPSGDAKSAPVDCIGEFRRRSRAASACAPSCGNRADRVADSWPSACKHALRGDADVVVRLQRFRDQVAECRILEQSNHFASPSEACEGCGSPARNCGGAATCGRL